MMYTKSILMTAAFALLALPGVAADHEDCTGDAVRLCESGYGGSYDECWEHEYGSGCDSGSYSHNSTDLYTPAGSVSMRESQWQNEYEQEYERGCDSGASSGTYAGERTELSVYLVTGTHVQAGHAEDAGTYSGEYAYDCDGEQYQDTSEGQWSSSGVFAGVGQDGVGGAGSSAGQHHEEGSYESDYGSGSHCSNSVHADLYSYDPTGGGWSYVSRELEC